MKFCKKCHRRIVEKFNGPKHYVWESAKICRCNISVVGNEDGPKVVIQRKRGVKRIWGPKKLRGKKVFFRKIVKQ